MANQKMIGMDEMDDMEGEGMDDSEEDEEAMWSFLKMNNL